jgi:hypothetical protein
MPDPLPGLVGEGLGKLDRGGGSLLLKQVGHIDTNLFVII